MEVTHNNLPEAFTVLMQKIDRIEKGMHEIATQAPPETFPEILQTPKAAQFLGITEQTLRIKCNNGELSYMKRNGRLYFSKSELIEYLKAGRRASNSEIMQAPAIANGLKPKKQTV